MAPAPECGGALPDAETPALRRCDAPSLPVRSAPRRAASCRHPQSCACPTLAARDHLRAGSPDARNGDDHRVSTAANCPTHHASRARSGWCVQRTTRHPALEQTSNAKVLRKKYQLTHRRGLAAVIPAHLSATAPALRSTWMCKCRERRRRHGCPRMRAPGVSTEEFRIIDHTVYDHNCRHKPSTRVD